MIKHELSDLATDKIRKIREWLDREEAGWIENCVGSQIAVLQAEATNLALTSPHKTIGDDKALPPQSIDLIKQAAVLQSFLDVFKNLREDETRFQTVKLTTT